MQYYIGAPPVDKGVFQVNLTCNSFVKVSSLVKKIGAVGTVGIVAPFPIVGPEFPIEFIAYI